MNPKKALLWGLWVNVRTCTDLQGQSALKLYVLPCLAQVDAVLKRMDP